MLRAARCARAVAAAAPLLASLAGCASLARQTARSYALAPSGLPVGEQRVRDALAAGRWGDALARAASAKQGGPDDALLRDLYAGTAAYYAGRWAESDAALGRAAALADDRFTRSASRGALALLTNDLALPYVPGENERLFVHYYGLLGRLRRGDAEGAAVEARRIGTLLAEYEDDGRDPLDAPTRGVLRYLSGAAFEAAGESEDAAVAYRNARALLGPGVAAEGAGPLDGFGDVVVVVEQGFVAHRVGEALSVRVRADGDWDLLLAAGHGAERAGSAVARVGSLFAGDRGLWADDLPRDLVLGDAAGSEQGGADTAAGGAAGGSSMFGLPSLAVGRASRVRSTSRAADVVSDVADAAADVAGGVADAIGDGGGRRSRAARSVLRVAWPAYRRTRGATRPVVVQVARDSGAMALAALTLAAGPAGAPVAPLTGPSLDAWPSVAAAAAPLVASADVSQGVVADFKRDRAARLARLLVRAATRAVATEQAGKKSRELADLVAGVGRVLERADTRSWHLLPGRVTVARLRLPAGRRAVTVDVGGTVVSLGEVDVPAGGIALATGRVY
jgi:hypothetical protein